MKEYKRPQFTVLKKRLSENRKFIQVITGPRQIGKTTIIKQLLESVRVYSTYISADMFSGNGSIWLEKHWEAARVTCKQNGNKYILAIDEIQKIPDWSNLVKKFWDEDSFSNTGLHVIISGSAGLLIRNGLTESLAGRFEIIQMEHWSFNEMNKAFGWNPEQFVWFGGYPGSSVLISDESRWKKYISDSLVETTISKDILMLTRIDKPALMKHLFDFGCSYSGQILSYTKMLGQLQDAGNTVTIAHYLRLLNNAGLLTGIEKYSGSIPRQKLSSPKLMVRNTSLISSRMTENFETAVRKPDLWGRLVESATGAHLINNTVDGNYSVWYWRDGNDEVDFVVQKENKLTALEIKSGTTTKRGGLDKFKKHYPSARIMIIGEKGFSWQKFLATNPLELLC